MFNITIKNIVLYHNCYIEINEEELNKIKRENKIFKRDIRNRKNKNKIYEDISLRISELKNSILHYENDIILVKDRIKEFANIKKYTNENKKF